MRGRKLSWLLIFLGLMGILSLLRFSHFLDTEPAPELTTDSPAPSTSPPFSPLPSHTQAQTRKIPALGEIVGKGEINRVEFQVQGGLAIAFGDVILGQPEEGYKDTQGFYEAPPIQTWDKPEIPYLINPELPRPDRVQKAIDYFNQNTPVKFLPYQGEKDAIVFEVGAEHCLSALGKTGGLQPIKLSEACQWTEIAHEMMHALGFIHEQSRMDRDQYVNILWDNIEDPYKTQFAIAPAIWMEPLKDSPFDFNSVMLYRPSAFVKAAGEVSLQSKTSTPINPVPQGLSSEDIRRLRHMYNGAE